MKYIITILTFLSLACNLHAADKLLAVNKDGDSMSVIDLASKQVLKNIKTGPGPHEVATTPNQRYAVVTDYGYGCGAQAGRTLTVVDLKDYSSRTIDLGQYRSPHGIVALKDNKRFVVSVECSDAVVVVDIEKGEVVQAVDTQAKVSHMVAVSADEKLAFTANIGSGSMSVVDLEKGQHVKNIATGVGAEGVDVAPDGKTVWVSNRGANTVSVIDIKTLEITDTIEVGKVPIRLKFTPDGQHALVSNAQSATLDVIDANTKKVAKTIAMTEQAFNQTGNVFSQGPVPIGVVVSADGQTAYVANTNVNEIRQIDLSSFKVTGILKAGERPDGLALVGD